MIYILYHSNCHDGCMAATIAYMEIIKKYTLPKDCRIETIPCKYGDPIYDRLDKKDLVFIVDFSYKENQLRELCSKVRGVTVIDHHITAKEEFDKCTDISNLTVYFDNNYSGAFLTYRYFNGLDSSPPYVVKLVSDRDLFKFVHGDDTRNLYTYMQTLNYKIEKYIEIYNKSSDEKFLTNILASGSEMRKITESLTDQYSDNPIAKIILCGEEMSLFNLTFEFGSDVCNKYLVKSGEKYCAYYLQTGLDQFTFGLRSSKEDYDVSVIAKLYGGGGHKCASGFNVNLDRFKQIIESSKS